MNKFLIPALALGAALSTISASASAAADPCPFVPVVASTEIINLVKMKGGWPMSDETCAHLHKHKLQLHVSGDAKVLSGVSLGWVSLRLSRGDNLVSGEYMSTTYVDNAEVSSTRAEQLLYMSLENGITKMNYEGATRSLEGLQVVSAKKQPGKAAK